MERYVILEQFNKNHIDPSYDMRGLFYSEQSSKIGFVTLIKLEHLYGLEEFKKKWSEKGAFAELDEYHLYMLDEPSGLVYSYDWFSLQDDAEKYYLSLSSKEKEDINARSDDAPYPVDFFREGKARYDEVMHKENLFELFASWDACAQKEYDYIVWYEDETRWVRLQGLDSLEEAQEFVKSLST